MSGVDSTTTDIQRLIQRHRAIRAAMSIGLEVLCAAGAVVATANGCMSSELAAVLGVTACGSVGVRALERAVSSRP